MVEFKFAKLGMETAIIVHFARHGLLGGAFVAMVLVVAELYEVLNN